MSLADLHPELKLFLSTRPNHGVPLQRFLEAAGVSTWAGILKLTRPDGARARDAMAQRYKPASIQHAVSAARSLLRFLADRGVLPLNVLADLRVTGRSQLPLWNVLQPGQAEKIIAAPMGPYKLRDRAVLLVLIDHGLRASELTKLTWKDLYREPTGRYVMTTVGKNGKPFRMRLKVRTVEAAQEWSKATIGPFIAAEKDGTPLTRQQVWSIVRRWGKAIGSRVTPHGLRATFITTMANEHGIEKAQRMARHENPATTSGYLRWQVLDDGDE